MKEVINVGDRLKNIRLLRGQPPNLDRSANNSNRLGREKVFFEGRGPGRGIWWKGAQFGSKLKRL